MMKPVSHLLEWIYDKFLHILCSPRNVKRLPHFLAEQGLQLFTCYHTSHTDWFKHPTQTKLVNDLNLSRVATAFAVPR